MTEEEIKIICEKDRVIFEGKKAIEYLKDLYKTACGEQAYEREELDNFFYPKEELEP